jgi:hypothetical protein
MKAPYFATGNEWRLDRPVGLQADLASAWFTSAMQRRCHRSHL